MFVVEQSRRFWFWDVSLWGLLISNLVTMGLAIDQGWNLAMIMWVYWFQSVTIGIFNFIRILNLEEFSTEGFSINNRPAQPTIGTKFSTAWFFLFHYGFFHFVYLIFLVTGTVAKFYGEGITMLGMGSILLTAGMFFVNHLFSYLYNKPRDTKRQNIGTLMFYPYARIIPMHLTIILGMAVGEVALPLFLGLKTVADVVMHAVEHYVIRRGEQAQS